MVRGHLVQPEIDCVPLEAVGKLVLIYLVSDG